MFRAISVSNNNINNTPSTASAADTERVPVEWRTWEEETPPGSGEDRNIAVLRMQECQEKQSTCIDFSCLNLTSLPEQLPPCQKLIIDSNLSQSLRKTNPDILRDLAQRFEIEVVSHRPRFEICEVPINSELTDATCIKIAEKFCNASDSQHLERHMQKIFILLTNQQPPASVADTLKAEKSARELTGPSLKAIAESQKKKISDYNSQLHNFFEKDINNWEHILPQESLVAHYNATESKVAQRIKMVNTFVTKTAFMYLENKKHHEMHAGTRWLILDKNPETPPVSVDEKLTSTLRDKIRNPDSEARTYDFNKALNMHLISHDGIDVYFHESLGYYYFENEGKDFFLDYKGRPLRKVNCEKDTPVADILNHEVARADYDKDIKNLLRHEGAPSCAMQLNQLHYSHQPEWHQARLNTAHDEHHKANNIANTSFFYALSKGNDVTFANVSLHEPSESEGKVSLHKLELKKNRTNK